MALLLLNKIYRKIVFVDKEQINIANDKFLEYTMDINDYHTSEDRDKEKKFQKIIEEIFQKIDLKVNSINDEILNLVPSNKSDISEEEGLIIHSKIVLLREKIQQLISLKDFINEYVYIDINSNPDISKLQYNFYKYKEIIKELNLNLNFLLNPIRINRGTYKMISDTDSNNIYDAYKSGLEKECYEDC